MREVKTQFQVLQVLPLPYLGAFRLQTRKHIWWRFWTSWVIVKDPTYYLLDWRFETFAEAEKAMDEKVNQKLREEAQHNFKPLVITERTIHQYLT